MNTQAGSVEGATLPLRQDDRTRTRGRFYFGMAAAMSLVVFVGFAPSFYLRAYLGPFLDVPPLASPLVYVHGLIFTGWMILLLLQTGLAATGNVRWHRRLGLAGLAVAILVVIVGITAQLGQTHRMIVTGELDRNPAAMSGLFLGAMLGMSVFAGVTGAAFYLRRRPEAHKRLMMLATIVLLGAAGGRIGGMLASAVPTWAPVTPYVSSGILLLFVAALLMHDLKTLKRVHSATVCGGVAIVALHILVQVITLTQFAGQPAIVDLVRQLAS